MNFDDFRGHIYLIDDDPSICRSLAFTLSSAHYSVQTFDGPRAFLKDSLPISPAVILLDMRMPEMSGTDLQNNLLRNGRETPIIFISGESQPSEIIEAMKQGAMDFLLKPFSMESLMRAIENGLDKDRSRQSELVRDLDMRQRFNRLTEKEQEICHSETAPQPRAGQNGLRNLARTDRTDDRRPAQDFGHLQLDACPTRALLTS
jgi:FixJ family two-component response regulator